MHCWLRTLLGLGAGLASCVQAGYLDEWTRMKSLVPRGYVCFRATNTIVPDGRLTEPTWQAAPWTLEFLPITGQTNATVAVRARGKLLWDSAHLYVAVGLETVAVPTTRLQASSLAGFDPEVGLVLDPDGDGHEYEELAVAADGLVRWWRHDKPPKDAGQRRPWAQATAVRVGVQVNQPSRSSPSPTPGWTFELAMPWQTLAGAAGSVPPDDREQWRLNICWKTKASGAASPAGSGSDEVLWSWSPHGVPDLYRPERWGYLQFSRKRGTRAAFIPDPGLAARNVLQGLYYAQKDFYARHGRWAVSLAELGYHFEPEPGLENAPVIRLTDEGFEATIAGPMQGLRPLRWHIRHDGRFWADAELQLQIRRYYQSVPDSLAEP